MIPLRKTGLEDNGILGALGARLSHTIVLSPGSIEELMLPPEVVCPGELSRLEPNKQYAPKTRLTRPRHESPVTHITG